MTSTTAVAVRPEDGAAVQTVLKSLVASWARNDAKTMATLYTEDATVILPGDTYLKGQQAIQSYMAEQFQGRWKGTHCLGVPVEMRYVDDRTLLLISQGGAYQPGAKEVSADDAIRGLWVFAKADTGWAVTAYENTPLREPIPIPASAG